jgi:hypothetical protein
MKEKKTHEDDALDALLRLVARPQAPDWFEARTLARLRRERAEAPPFGFRLFRKVAMGCCVVLLILIGGLTLHRQQASEDPLFAALEAFESYTQEASEWNQEPYP